ncbi:MAG: tail fiber protein [Chloroflexota bacterium]
MTEPYIGEIRLFGFNFPPRGWARCDGALLSIEQNQALYSILGTAFGGDGRTDFALPDMRGRTPMHVDSGFAAGTEEGEEFVALTVTEIPNHTHSVVVADSGATSNDPTGRLLAQASIYGAATSLEAMSASSVGNAGGGQGHNNMQPFLVVNFCIAVEGTFPPRN